MAIYDYELAWNERLVTWEIRFEELLLPEAQHHEVISTTLLCNQVRSPMMHSPDDRKLCEYAAVALGNFLEKSA